MPSFFFRFLFGNKLCGLLFDSCTNIVKKFPHEAVPRTVIELVILSLIILVTLLVLSKQKVVKELGVTMEVKTVTDSSKKDGPVFFGKGVRVYGLNVLLGSEAEVLGNGTFGITYKIFLEDGDLVVKRLKGSFAFGRDKVEGLGQLVHENLLPLRAYCCRDDALLIFDFMPMGSLSALLHGSKSAKETPLNWDIRSRIAYGVARGVEYLHSQGLNSCHGNIRSSNILLTNSYDARVSEFGIAQLVSPESKLKLIAGYHAPEVTNAHEVSQKTDVYSFGVLLLELLSGKAPLHANSNKTGVDLPKWVRLMFQERPVIDVFDNELERNRNIEEQMFQVLQLAICCTFEYPHKRPSMAAVTNRIKEICGFDP